MEGIEKSVIITLTLASIGAAKLILFYIITSKWICCSGGQKSILNIVSSCCKRACCGKEQQGDINSSDKDNHSTLCKSMNLVATVEVFHCFTKVVIIASNIAYLVILPDPDEGKLLNEKREQGRLMAYYLTYAMSYYEIAIILAIPLYIFVLTYICYHLELNRKGFCSYVKLGDLTFALIVTPVSNVYLHYVGGLYWVFIIIRVIFYCTTFVSVVIVGIRFFLAFCCIKCAEFACCTDEEVIEIRDCKHLIFEVGYQVFSITVNLLTGASALATYFTIAVIQTDPVRYAYLAFTALSCFNAIAATFYNAVLLRWVVLTEDEKANESIGSKTLEFLKIKAPSSHIAFVLGLTVQFGLIGLNVYIMLYGSLE